MNVETAKLERILVLARMRLHEVIETGSETDEQIAADIKLMNEVIADLKVEQG